jgi:hypothetical protein
LINRKNDGELPFVAGELAMFCTSLPVAPAGSGAGSVASLTGIPLNFNAFASAVLDAVPDGAFPVPTRSPPRKAAVAGSAGSFPSNDAISSGLPAWNEANVTADESGLPVEDPMYPLGGVNGCDGAVKTGPLVPGAGGGAVAPAGGAPDNPVGGA